MITVTDGCPTLSSTVLIFMSVVPHKGQSWALKSLENIDSAPNARQDMTYTS